MKSALVAVAALVCLAACKAATTASTCQSSENCSSGQCCRTSEGQVIPGNDGSYGWGYNPFYGEGPTGTCVTGKASEGEVCDSVCECSAGFECYRPMSGACCPPQTCMDAEYVQQQREYWANCHNDPNCFFPP